jgi:Protein of unknown function (DUF1320)
MAFLVKEDLYPQILQDELEEITRGDNVLIASSCSAAVAEMKLYLFDSYDTEGLFAAGGRNRHELLLQIGADMAIYFIVARCQAGQQLEDRTARYKRAVAILKQMRDSENYSDLPRREKTKQSHMVLKTNAKRGNYF